MHRRSISGAQDRAYGVKSRIAQTRIVLGQGERMAEKLLQAEHTERIIGVYFQVFNKLGHTYPEFIYERAMLLLLQKEGINCVRQDEYQIWYKQVMVGRQRLDLFVADEVVVELKVAERILPLHQAQLLSYMRTVAKEVGLLMRFGGPKPEFARRVLSRPVLRELDPSTSIPNVTTKVQDSRLEDEIINALTTVFAGLGPGFIHRIYANACYYELRSRGFDVQVQRELRLFLDTHDLGTIKLGHLQVGQQVLVFPVAISSLNQLRFADLRAWLRYLHIPVGIVANFNAVDLEPVVLRA